MKNRIGVVDAPFSVRFEQRETPQPGADEAIVAVKASAICGSDLHIFRGKHPSVGLPATIGHEFSGDIVAIGAQRNGFSVGDRVTLEPVIACGHCDACLRGQYGYCENISFSYRQGDGSMADYVRVKTRFLYPLPEGLSYEAGALIEPLSVAAHAVRRSGITLGDRVAIFGAGAIGILTAAVCRACGASEVLITDLSDFRLEMAKAFGATLAVPAPMEDIDSYIPGGADKTFECVGLEATFRQAMTALRRGGVMTQVGIFERPEITIDASRFVTHEISIVGAQGYCWDFPAALMLAGRIPLETLVTHTLPLDQLKTALETAANPASNAVKVLLKP